MILNDNIMSNLQEVFTDLDCEGSLDDCLEELSSLVARFLNARGCIIAILTEDEVRQAASGLRTGFGFLPGTPTRLRKAMARGRPDRLPARSRPRIIVTGAMFSTIVLKGKTVGVIQALSPKNNSCFDQGDLDLLNILTPIITKSIQVFQLQHVLRSQFTQLSLIRTNEAKIRETLSGAIHSPNQIARLLAKSFYREMLNAGFSFNQILFAATEVISELSASVKKHTSRRKFGGISAATAHEVSQMAPQAFHAGDLGSMPA
jgi:L-methionine (R)-S-oxide reductase